ncbi:hypothetical protein PRIPAC_80458 [Pristionchus pacificus]|uniref:G protein-coupled receptor n=1 Tax=Pristionchus pacificus TaxID=54126 RepID=A0A2A6CMD3_PRIPA|nr:hypothetical protein PRIPAC_80458 [Pristionchus pacificus]|eukprot:PDM79405.1 G protein-coupled receptor [Pristionchus pacificus]
MYTRNDLIHLIVHFTVDSLAVSANIILLIAIWKSQLGSYMNIFLSFCFRMYILKDAHNNYEKSVRYIWTGCVATFLFSSTSIYVYCGIGDTIPPGTSRASHNKIVMIISRIQTLTYQSLLPIGGFIGTTYWSLDKYFGLSSELPQQLVMIINPIPYASPLINLLCLPLYRK